MPVRPTDPSVPESRAERLIREAMEAGQFENLPGTGKPIPGRGTTDDDLWWVRNWVRRNRRSADGPMNQESSSFE